MTEFDVGENGVLSWSPPVPPNGDILYYNVIITRAYTGELVIRVEELYDLTIDVSKYGEINMYYSVEVFSIHVPDVCNVSCIVISDTSCDIGWWWKLFISSHCSSQCLHLSFFLPAPYNND